MDKNMSINDFWEDSEYALEKYVCKTLTAEEIDKVEKSLGYKLPDSYINLMKIQNGGIPKNNEIKCSNGKNIVITGIFGIGFDKERSLCGKLGSQFWINEWEYPNIGIAICDTISGGHDMIFLDYRECGVDGEPKVVHIDQENDYQITFVANNFEEFIKNLSTNNN